MGAVEAEHPYFHSPAKKKTGCQALIPFISLVFRVLFCGGWQLLNSPRLHLFVFSWNAAKFKWTFKSRLIKTLIHKKTNSDLRSSIPCPRLTPHSWIPHRNSSLCFWTEFYWAAVSERNRCTRHPAAWWVMVVEIAFMIERDWCRWVTHQACLHLGTECKRSLCDSHRANARGDAFWE